jgi:hypothetical protein
MKRAFDHKPVRDFAVVLMLAAVAGTIAQVVGTVIEVGRTAGLWSRAINPRPLSSIGHENRGNTAGAVLFLSNPRTLDRAGQCRSTAATSATAMGGSGERKSLIAKMTRPRPLSWKSCWLSVRPAR